MTFLGSFLSLSTSFQNLCTSLERLCYDAERSKNIYFLLRKSLRNFYSIRNEDNFRPQALHYEKQQLATRYDVTPAVDEHGAK